MSLELFLKSFHSQMNAIMAKVNLYPTAFNLVPKAIGKLQVHNITHALRSNLAIALYLTPRTRRNDIFIFYSLCHQLDAHIDSSSLTFIEKEKILQSYEEALKNPEKPLLQNIHQIIEQHHLDHSLFQALIEGMKMDLFQNRYLTFKDLHLYAWRVASTVGLITTQLFGATGKNARDYAEQLGIALQMTNILRDVAEDASLGRIYLPLDELNRFNVTEEEILQRCPSPQATHLLHYQAERALSYFAKADLAWEKMSFLERRRMRPGRMMEAIYRTLLEKMQQSRYDVFHQRHHVHFLKKLSLMFLVLSKK